MQDNCRFGLLSVRPVARLAQPTQEATTGCSEYRRLYFVPWHEKFTYKCIFFEKCIFLGVDGAQLTEG